MRVQRQPSQRVVVAFETDGGGVADVADDLDALAGFADAETLAGEDILVAFGMELGEAFAELELFAVDADGAIGPIGWERGLVLAGWEALDVDAQEVAHPGPFELQITCHPVEALDMHDVATDGTEDPLQHVVEMHPDVGGYAAALMLVALPRGVVPLAPGGDVGEVDVVDLVLGAFLHLALQGHDGVVQAQLQDGIGLVAGLGFQLHQVVDIIRIKHHGFLADDVAAQPQAVADEGVVGVVGGADGEVVQSVAVEDELGAEAVHNALVHKERAVGKRLIELAHAVEFVEGSDQIVAGVGDGFDVPGGDIAGDTDQCEVLVPHSWMVVLCWRGKIPLLVHFLIGFPG